MQNQRWEPPIHWVPPDTFDPAQPGLGLPALDGVSHRIIYEPKSCGGNVDEGGDGRYESLQHGTYVHGPTNLHGEAMPAAGELPDGRVWIIGNARDRREMYLTLSDDGVTFDRSWSLLTIERQGDGGHGKGGGPQYFQTITVGQNLWVIYSITKEMIGVTRIPLNRLA